MSLSKKLRQFKLAICVFLSFVNSVSGIQAMSKNSSNSSINCKSKSEVVNNFKSDSKEQSKVGTIDDRAAQEQIIKKLFGDVPEQTITKKVNPIKVETPTFHNRYKENLKEIEYQEYEDYYRQQCRHTVFIKNGFTSMVTVRLLNGKIRNGYKPIESFKEFSSIIFNAYYMEYSKLPELKPLNLEIFIELDDANPKIKDIFLKCSNCSEFRHSLIKFIIISNDIKKQNPNIERKVIYNIDRQIGLATYILDTVRKE